MPFKRRAWLWIAVSSGLLVLSMIAIGVRVAGYPEYVPRAIAGFLDDFVEPGSALWWMTTGGVFQAFPSDAAGYAVVSIGNTAAWMVAWAVCASLVRLVARAARQLLARGTASE
jgi:hypothetical protein